MVVELIALAAVVSEIATSPVNKLGVSTILGVIVYRLIDAEIERMKKRTGL